MFPFLQGIRVDKEGVQEVRVKIFNVIKFIPVVFLLVVFAMMYASTRAVGAEAKEAVPAAIPVSAAEAPAPVAVIPQPACSLPEKPSGATGNLLTKWERTRGFCGIITKAAESAGLDRLLVSAVIWQESGGNPEAVSKSGAVGLMQVMPRDGIAADVPCKYGPCFADRPTIEELKDPEFNVNYGTGFLGGLIASEGSIRDGLMRYGPKDVGYYYADIILGLYERLK